MCYVHVYVSINVNQCRYAIHVNHRMSINQLMSINASILLICKCIFLAFSQVVWRSLPHRSLSSMPVHSVHVYVSINASILLMCTCIFLAFSQVVWRSLPHRRLSSMLVSHVYIHICIYILFGDLYHTLDSPGCRYCISISISISVSISTSICISTSISICISISTSISTSISISISTSTSTSISMSISISVSISFFIAFSHVFFFFLVFPHLFKDLYHTKTFTTQETLRNASILYVYVYVYVYVFVSLSFSPCLNCSKTFMGWLRLVGSLKLYVSLKNIGLFCRALLQKRPIILRSLLTIATPYHIKTFTT